MAKIRIPGLEEKRLLTCSFRTNEELEDALRRLADKANLAKSDYIYNVLHKHAFGLVHTVTRRVDDENENNV